MNLHSMLESLNLYKNEQKTDIFLVKLGHEIGQEILLYISEKCRESP